MLQFRSYIQPILILMIVPFGMIGAVWGHALLGLPLTLFSMFGLVALSGVVINDSIVLIDFINSRVRDGLADPSGARRIGRKTFPADHADEYDHDCGTSAADDGKIISGSVVDPDGGQPGFRADVGDLPCTGVGARVLLCCTSKAVSFCGAWEE